MEDCLSGFDALEDHLSARELSRRLDAFLDSLSPGDRYIFVRRCWYVDPVGELAEKVNVSPNALSVKLYRLREKLRRELIREGFDI